MKSWVDVLVPGRHVERFRISDAGLTLGSSPSADIKLSGAPGILPVHCQLRPEADGCWVELVDTAPDPFRYQGTLSRACVVAWGQDVFLGALRLTLSADGVAPGATKRSPLVWVAALAVPLLVAMAFFSPDPRARSAMVEEEPPRLFGDLPPCSESKAGAVGRGSVAEQVGMAKHERGVFVLKDSVDGVQLMREASACYALGDNQGASDRAFDRAEEWLTDLQFTYKRALLDLETGRRERAGPEVLDAALRLQILLSHAGSHADAFRQRVAQHELDAVVAIEEARKAAEKKK